MPDDNSRLRHFRSLKDFFTAAGKLASGTKFLRKAGNDDKLSAALAEKIMLAVTSVNECAYCSYLHTQTALRAGVDGGEIREILSGVFDNGTAEETTLLLYARHWADTRGNPSAEAGKKLLDLVGPGKAGQVEAYLRIIYMGNMCSNTAVFFEDKTVSKADKAGLLPVYLLCKPIAGSIRARGLKLGKAASG
jgi:AhpD family alkylhydroperoxidase